MTDQRPDTWQDALTRRLRTLLRTAPLHRVELNKVHRADALPDQDLRALALRTLDITIEKMGLGTGATFEDLREGLRPLILLCCPRADHDAADAVADVVIEGLLNEPQRRQAFSEPYLSLTPGAAVKKVLSFHLLRERETAEGETVVCATTEGINLYAGMLEYPVEDAQIAEEAVLHAQIQRGRIADAVRTARRARLRSIEYEQKILGILETTRRDVQQVDWVNRVLELLDAARLHVTERIDTERTILRAVEGRFDAADERETTVQLVSLREALDECVTRHLRLHERLIGANQLYLDEQERQAFRPLLAEPLPDLEAEVLRGAAALPAATLAALADPLLARFLAPRASPAVRLVQVIDRLLAPRREVEAPHPSRDPDLEQLPPERRSFSPLDHAAVDALLDALQTPTTLGGALARARDAGLSTGALHLLVLRVLGAFDPDLEDRGLIVEAAGAPLRDPRFLGDDLTLERPERAGGSP